MISLSRNLPAIEALFVCADKNLPNFIAEELKDVYLP